MSSAYIEISKSNLLHNLHTIKNYAKKDVIPVVKANAYGHGSSIVASVLRNEGIELLAVAFPKEAEELRANGDRGEILVLVEGDNEDIRQIVELRLQASISRIEFANELNRKAEERFIKIKCHIFIDTGMHRDGIDYEDAIDFINEVAKLENLEIVGICSHFANSDDLDTSFTNTQISKFEYVLDRVKAINFNYIHIQNSAGIVNYNIARATHVRPGIALYGLLPEEHLNYRLNVNPILTLRAKVVRVKHIQANETAGYSFKFIAKENTQIGFLPLGYGDGLNTALTNKFKVVMKDRAFECVGSICMDQILIDFRNYDVNIGDSVEVISSTPKSINGVYELSKLAGVIPYDITTKLLPRLERILVD
jgi:alanine racemase